MTAQNIDGAATVSSDKSRASLSRDVLEPTRRLRRILSLDDFETIARRRLPPVIYGYEREIVVTGARTLKGGTRFHNAGNAPRVLMDVAQRCQTAEVFGQRYASPFGIALLGGPAMVAYRGDLKLAEAARDMNVPMIMSAS